MTYVVTEACIRCKYMDCVEVCPVDCFYEGENMLVIHPDECIDCGVCEPECPIEAILPDTEGEAEKWLELNRDYCERLAQHHPQAPAARRRRRAQGRGGQVREVFQRRARHLSARPGPPRLRPSDTPEVQKPRGSSPFREAGNRPHFVLIITQHE